MHVRTLIIAERSSCQTETRISVIKPKLPVTQNFSAKYLINRMVEYALISVIGQVSDSMSKISERYTNSVGYVRGTY